MRWVASLEPGVSSGNSIERLIVHVQGAVVKKLASLPLALAAGVPCCRTASGLPETPLSICHQPRCYCSQANQEATCALRYLAT